MFQLNEDEKRKRILKTDNHLLIMGGPGSGKTTIALFKAKQIIQADTLRDGQRILFLSFARATISRIEENVGSIIPTEIKQHIEINTYHGFIWNILKHHGYLLSAKPIKILPPHESSKYLRAVNAGNRTEKLYTLFQEKGLVHFDLFAQLCTELLTQSQALRNVISKMYPIIILDEFQDTNANEWQLINAFGANCRLIALADPDQRIYDFRGADPKRVTQFIEQYHPDMFDFGNENNRSSGTDIVQFGNDLLAMNNTSKVYQNVHVIKYQFRKAPNTHLFVKECALQSIRRLRKAGNSDWSLAILVPTNALMLQVSDMLQRKQRFVNGSEFPAIFHDVAIEMTGPSLAALFLACLLEEGSQNNCQLKNVVRSLVDYILGRRGADSITGTDAQLVTGLENFINTDKAIGARRKRAVDDCAKLARQANDFVFSGNIIADWKSLAAMISKCQSESLQDLGRDIGFVRLLQRGSLLYSSLDNIWRTSLTYKGAISAVSDALTQEHFSLSTKKWAGVNVMTIHKAKGKEFDEVIIYEGRFQNRIVSRPERINQARLNLRVAVTRAKKEAIILTPADDPCPLV